MEERPAPVPARSKALLEAWVREFLAESAAHGVTIKVAVQDGSEGRDTGLVVVDLGNGGAEVYMQPASLDNTRWETTLTSRPGDLTLSPMKLAAIAAEVAVASDLCLFLQFKSLEWDRMSGMHVDDA
ncbi:hypothetical protein [Microbacterium oleivorans]|uniref:hypothetical protein n=1 Tax=Microbacterium TaxID=33882 RepID=UPI00203CF41E|nr:hypothetical protein [Microbacterium oleivorans]MCM3697712.1 hypothetical protein [Microbacterium oleivorans]